MRLAQTFHEAYNRMYRHPLERSFTGCSYLSLELNLLNESFTYLNLRGLYIVYVVVIVCHCFISLLCY